MVKIVNEHSYAFFSMKFPVASTGWRYLYQYNESGREI